MVDITNSLRTGKMDSTMINHWCMYYIVHPSQENIVDAAQYYYLPRHELNNLQMMTSPPFVWSICKQKLKDAQGQFKYDPGKKDKIPMQHYCVLNPDKPGAVGITIELNGEKRIMIASGKLSGCGFAVLTDVGGKVYVIHAGASDTSPDVYAASIDIKRQMINRDIFLMAMTLKMPEEYDVWFPYVEGCLDIQNGLTCEKLFCLLQSFGFQGFVYVRRENNQLICDGDCMQLAVRSYTPDAFHDVVAVINEKGKMASTLRDLETVQDGMQVANSIQNQICLRS